MASNPMQRKARNSFLLGMLVMLLISGVIIALLFMQLMNENKKNKEEQKASVQAYALTQDVQSGQEITMDMLKKITVNSTLVPNNATSDIKVFQNYALKDKEGNEIKTRYEENGKKYQLYISINGKNYDVNKEEDTENYYYERNEEKVYVELNTVPLIAKVDMRKNTLLTTDLISKSDNFAQNDIREQEYNVVVLPTDLTTGDYIDVRVLFPNGQDFIVVSKKEVEIPNIGGVDSDDTISINLSEDEILHMSCAIVDVAQVKGAKLYATKYTEPGMQSEATPTYIVNGSTTSLLK